MWVRSTAWVLWGPSVAAPRPPSGPPPALAAGLLESPYHCCLSSLLHSDCCLPEASRRHQRAREGRGCPGQQGKLLRVSSAPLGGGRSPGGGDGSLLQAGMLEQAAISSSRGPSQLYVHRGDFTNVH